MAVDSECFHDDIGVPSACENGVHILQNDIQLEAAISAFSPFRYGTD
jgi:hypothetical protein